ncbi:MAG TPA: hypothetical protein VFS21_07595 [Roseiflexaceae bacterium]|nr:hypothetical protein [Roseiflexaceae bacterium]
MTIFKQIICLANSRKIGGRCIAGKELVEDKQIGRWVRPVSNREHNEVSEREYCYEDGNEPSVLDIIEVPLLYATPKEYQQENWLLDPEYWWEKVGDITWEDVRQIVDPVEPLWINNFSTFHGINDYIPNEDTNSLRSSLRLIFVDRLEISVFDPGASFNNPKRRVQGRFQYGGLDYWLWVTDPIYENKYLALKNGNYVIGESIITISLGKTQGDRAYKLIASIIQPHEN